MTEAEQELMEWMDKWDADVFDSCGTVMVVVGGRIEDLNAIENRWKQGGRFDRS